MPRYYKYDFPAEPEIKRTQGSDQIKDVNGKWHKLRTWSAVDAEWKLTKLGHEYYTVSYKHLRAHETLR